MKDESYVFWVQQFESDSPQAIGLPEHRNLGGALSHFQKDLLISLPIHF